MSTTVLIEPFPGGHRAQAVAHVAAVAGRTSEVLVMTSVGGPDDPAFAEYLGDADVRVVEAFDEPYPPTREIARRLAALCRVEDVDTAVLMDADQALKRWWFDAPRAFGLRKRPRVVFMLTRYPATLALTDWVGWRLRIPKAALSLAAMASRTLHRVAGFAGRDDTSRGALVKRVRDPEVCTAHSRDRAALRSDLGLPDDRPLVGIFGGVSERKHPELIWAAMRARDLEADLLLAGGLSPGVAAWVATVEPTDRARVVVRDGFLSNEVLDQMVAASDVAALVMTNNGPSGIMGKALAAAVPVVTAGSLVRAREVAATGGGVATDLERDAIAVGIEQMLARGSNQPRRSSVPPATADEFGESLLGVPPGRTETTR